MSGVYVPVDKPDPRRVWRYAAAAVVGIGTVALTYFYGPAAVKLVGAMIYGALPFVSQNSAGFMGALVGYGSMLGVGAGAAVKTAGWQNIKMDLNLR